MKRTTSQAMSYTPESAKQFLLTKLFLQAAHDGVSLDDIEKRMFVFCEQSANPDRQANEVFSETYDSEAYEAKIATLLHKAFKADKRTLEGKQEWVDALQALRKEDFYGLVMIDQAGIPRKREALRNDLWRFELEELPFEVIEIIVIVAGFVVVFRPALLGLVLPDWIRWLAYLIFLWLVWLIARIWSRMRIAKAIKRSERRDG